MADQKKLSQMRLDTRIAHAGLSPQDYHGFVNPPVVRASTVLFPDTQTLWSRDVKYTYGTTGTPTTQALSDAIDMLEGSVGTIIVPSGLAAVTIPMLAFAKAGDHCLIVDSVYGPSRVFANEMLAKLGVEIEYFDPAIGAGFANLLRDNTSIVLIEAPGSNTFEMLDVRAICDAAHQTDAVVMMDNTWATPLFFKPLDFGVDISIHALTKYPGGHSDLVLGSVSANEKHWKQLRTTFNMLGACAQGDDCFAVLRGLRSMPVRLAKHEKSALQVASWLTTHQQVEQVLHPALPNDPGHEIWRRDFKGSSGLFAFVLKNADKNKTAAFLDSLSLFGLGYSWGGYESLAVPVNLSDRTIAKGPEGGALIRLQIGLEDPLDLIADLESGFSAVR